MSGDIPSATDLRWTLAPIPTPETLALSDEDVIVSTIVEADAYRRLAQAACHQLHTLLTEYQRLRLAHHRLIEQYRALRRSEAA